MNSKATHFTPNDRWGKKAAWTSCGKVYYPENVANVDGTQEPRWVTCKACKRTAHFKREQTKCTPLVGD